jgi:nitroimidazol reductase NimA-like FMN-containing flavoprotein (pyridoxamine 5'-phosphate oxidase superfamily)
MASGTPPELTATDRTRVRRKRDRAVYRRDAINAIVDEGLICHVGFTHDGTTIVLPMAYGRVGDVLYLHGAAANAMLKTVGQGVEACVTITLVDSLVLARSAFHHSMNYRSAVLVGTAETVVDEAEKSRALAAVVEHMVPGRSADARPPTPKELVATSVVRFPIEEGSAKVRTGGPVDDDEDLALAVWAGQIPLELVARPPVPDTRLARDIALPAYAREYPDRGAAAGG